MLFTRPMIKKFSSPKMRNRQFVFAPKIEYQSVAERSEANQNSLTFPFWCRGRESNSHGLLRTILSRVRLPIPPPRLTLYWAIRLILIIIPSFVFLVNH